MRALWKWHYEKLFNEMQKSLFVPEDSCSVRRPITRRSPPVVHPARAHGAVGGFHTAVISTDDGSHSVTVSQLYEAGSSRHDQPASSATQLWSLHPCRRRSAAWKTVSDSRGCRLVRGELNTSRSRTVQTCRDAWRRAAPELSLSAVFSSSSLPAAECKSDWVLVTSYSSG